MFDNNIMGQFFNSFPDGVLICKGDGTILHANREIGDLLGYAPKELLGSSVELLMPERMRSSHKILREVYATDPHSRGMTAERYLIARKRDNSELPVTISLSPFYDKSNSLVIVCIRDNSEVQRLRLKEKAIDAKLQLAQKSESLNLLSSGIAHDFNNLLFVMMANVDLALAGLPEETSLRPKLTNIRNVTEQLTKLTKRLMTYSCGQALEKTDVDISGLGEEMCKLLRVSIPKDIELNFHTTGDIPSLKADACQLRQLISNLIINSAEAIDSQSGVIDVSTGISILDDEDGLLDVMGNPATPGEYAFLEVKDSGIGMDELTLRKLFDPYFSTKFVGRGLGLSIVHGVVKSHGGILTVFSEQDKGTIFRAYIPRNKLLYVPELLELKQLASA